MKIELKAIKFNEAFSEETNCYKANVYVNGKLGGEASNDGRGGCTFIHTYNGDAALIKAANEYCATLPHKTYDSIPNKTFPILLEDLVDELLYKHLLDKDQKKFDKKLQKAGETSIVFGVPNGSSFKQVGFKSKAKLTFIMQTPQGRAAVVNLINHVKSKLDEGEAILNTNLGSLV